MNESHAPLIGFVGTTPNIGTTCAAFAAAYRLAEEHEGEFLFLDLNLKSAKLHRYLGADRPGMTLDRLRPELLSGALTPGRLASSLYHLPHNPRLHVLFGNMLRDQAEYFTPQEVDRLLDTGLDSYSAVIADVSAYWDNAATIAVLRRAGLRLLSTTPALASFQEDGKRWIGQVSPLFGIAPTDYKGIVISPPWRNGGFPVRDIRKEMGIPIADQLLMTESLVMQLDSGRLEEWLRADKHGQTAMKSAAELISRTYALKRGGEKKRQPWYRKLAAIRSGAQV